MYESIKMDMRRLQVDYQFLGRQIQMKNHQNLILVKMQLEKNNENDIERILDDSMQTRGITTYVKNGSAQKYGKEYSPKSGDKFVLSVAKGETVVLTKEIINTTCRGMPNSCTIQRRHNLRTKQQVRELKKEHSGKDEKNIIIWEAEEAKQRGKKC